MLLQQTTTIEGSEIDRVKKMVKRGKIKATTFPFDMGVQRNVAACLGTSPSEWLLWGNCEGDGLSYPSRPGTGAQVCLSTRFLLTFLEEPYNWPPRDPYSLLRQSWEREAQVQRSRYPPYHPRYSALDAEADDDDEVPLADLRSRSVRIRRGSEGFEVRSHLASADVDDVPEIEELLESDQSERSSDWEELYQRRQHLYDSGSEGDE